MAEQKKIFCVVGTRPQLIKHSVLLKHLQTVFEVITVNTTQHYQHELNGQFLQDLFGEASIYSINLDPELSPAQRLASMISAIAPKIANENPKAVLVYGDTDSTLAGALAAKKCGAKLVHIEAGERSGNQEMPEEQNRMVTDVLSDFLLCASHQAVTNLQRENNRGAIIYTGDIMKDLLLQTSARFQKAIVAGDYFFCTLHRHYNQKNEEKIKELLQVLQQLAKPVFFSLHPATAQTVNNLGLQFSNIRFLPPLNYFQSVHYQKFATAIITDSGGMQKEAYWLRRPCITIRKETEWADTLIGNWNQLAYDDLPSIEEMLQAPRTHYDPQLYGDGNAAALICRNLGAAF